MKKLFNSSKWRAMALAIASLGSWSAASAQTSATDLFISEYVEGSGFNKYVEIYNGTSSSVNLSDYQLRLYSNGSAAITASFNLSGTLNSCDVIVVGNSSGTIYEEDLVANTVCNFNGDDAVALVKISTGAFVDIFGNIGCDPGTIWGTIGSNVTADRSLRRNCGVIAGVSVDPAGTSGSIASCPFPTLAAEWTVSAGIDDASNLGMHDCACGAAPCSTGLFFSQYTEGSGFNKCVEIANFTGAAVSLTGYQIRAFHNGNPGPTPSFTINLSGSIADGDVFVVCNPSANTALLGVSDQLSSNLQHNGDDALVLVSPLGATLDIIGQIGCDPGTSWSSSGNSTADATLTRSSAVTGGVTVNPVGPCGTGSFATLGTQWFASAADVAAGFGSHTVACGPQTAPSPELGSDQVLCAGGSVTLDAGAGTSYLWSTGATTPSITVSASGVYSVTVTNSVGTGTDRVAVIIKSPIGLSISGAASVCAGAPATLSAAVTAPELFISEYVEGTSNNKALEIANFTGSPVDLGAAGYSIQISYNGGTGVANIALTGVIANGDVHVLASNLSSAALLALADQITTTSLWNGDDAITLKRGATVVDVFGVVGVDPGAQWGNPLVLAERNTENQTLRRNCSVLSGINASPTATGASGFLTLQTEWSESLVDDFSGLGSHAICPALLWSTGASSSSIVVSPTSSTTYSVTATTDNGCGTTASFVVTVSNPQVFASADVTICSGETTTLCADVNSRELFFSEYVEGSGLNKCIEIFNNTGGPVNLSTYSVEVVFNGGTSTAALPLSGILADGDVYVLCSNGAAADFLASADATTSSSMWNGNDALVLKNGTQIVDIFGVINSNPGLAWVGGANSTADMTLRRVASVVEGISVNPVGTGVGAFTTLGSEWVALPINTSSGLGRHTFTPAGTFSWTGGGSTACTDVAPTTTTTYTVTYTDAAGCTATDAVTVSVNPSPVVDAGDCYTVYSGYAPASCTDITAVVTSGTAPFSYLWSNGATSSTINVCPTSTTAYTVTVTDANGCTGTDVVTVNVIDAICGRDKVEICHIPPGSPLSATTLCIASSAVASHLAHGDHLGSCSELDPCTLSGKSAPLATGAEALEAGVSAYPNPFSSKATVAFTLTEAGDATITLFDVNGVMVQQIFNGQVESSIEYTVEVDGSNLADGIYFIQLASGTTRIMEKLVLVK